MTEIFYNSQNIVESGQPTPFISKSVSPVVAGDKYGILENFTINGIIISCSFNDFWNKRKTLLQKLSQDFKTLQIIENSSTIFTRDFCKIDSVNFPNEKYIGRIPYSIQISCYPEEYFSDNYGVVDISDVWSFQEERDKTISISHTVSARGINTNSTSNNAILNAKNFVENRTGINSSIQPHFICSPNYNPCLISSGESIDRFNGTYSITETYRNDMAFDEGGLLRYSINITQPSDGFWQISLSGVVESCKDSSVNVFRDRYSSLDKFSLVSELYSKVTSQSNLNPTPLSSNVNEDLKNRKLSFSINYDNDPSPLVTVETTTTIQEGESFITASVNGTIRARGNLKDRWPLVQQRYSQVNTYNICNAHYLEFNSIDAKGILNPNPTNESLTRNENRAIINFSATYDDRPPVPDPFEDLNLVIEMTPSITQINTVPLFDKNGKHDVIDLGFANRSTLTINGNAVKKKNATSTQAVNAIKSIANSKLAQYGSSNKIFKEVDSVTFTNENQLSVNISWTFNRPAVNPSYSTVGSLLLK